MIYISDIKRHLVCWPYSEESLHKMAEELDIKRSWFHKKDDGLSHYDIPRNRMDEIKMKTKLVTPRKLIGIMRYSLLDFDHDLRTEPQHRSSNYRFLIKIILSEPLELKGVKAREFYYKHILSFKEFIINHRDNFNKKSK